MKKYSMFMAGILGIMLVFVMVLAGCKTEPDPNPFEGTWKGEEGGDTLTITDSGWEVEENSKGTYTRDGNNATLTVTHSWDEDNKKWEEEAGAATFSATVSGNTLTVDAGDEKMTFTKQ
jgi:uncharacterized protein (DUF2147 family)